METTHPTIAISDVDRVHLLDLLHMNIDSRNGFAYAGKRLAEKHSSLAMRFHRYSQQRNDFFEKIKEIEMLNHQEPSERGTFAASLHRTWMELRDELNENVDVSALVFEAKRGESYIKEAYESAIAATTEPKLHAILSDQYEAIKESYGWLSGLQAEHENRMEKAR